MIIEEDKLKKVITKFLELHDINLNVQEAYALHDYIVDENNLFFKSFDYKKQQHYIIGDTCFIVTEPLKKYTNIILVFKRDYKKYELIFKRQYEDVYDEVIIVKVIQNDTIMKQYKYNYWHMSLIEEKHFIDKNVAYVKTSTRKYYTYNNKPEGPYRQESNDRYKVGICKNGYKVKEEKCYLKVNDRLLSKYIYHDDKQELISYIMYSSVGDIIYTSYEDQRDKNKRIRVTCSFDINKKPRIHYHINNELKATTFKEIFEKGYV